MKYLKFGRILLLVFFICLFLGSSIGHTFEKALINVVKLLYEKTSSIQTYEANYVETIMDERGNLSSVEGKYFYKKGVGLKIVTQIPGQQQGGESRIQVVTRNAILDYDRIANVVVKINLKKLRANFGEKYAPLFDPMENSVLIKPFIFLDLINYKPVKLTIERKKEKTFYVFSLEWRGLMQNSQNVASGSEGAPPPPPNARLWVDGDSGLLSKVEIYDERGGVVYRLEVKDVKINIEIPDQNFNFVPTAGVKIVDDTFITQRNVEFIKDSFSPEFLEYNYQE
jgi:outer membrane lipoprotein-sorting protein